MPMPVPPPLYPPHYGALLSNQRSLCFSTVPHPTSPPSSPPIPLPSFHLSGLQRGVYDEPIFNPWDYLDEPEEDGHASEHSPRRAAPSPQWKKVQSGRKIAVTVKKISPVKSIPMTFRRKSSAGGTNQAAEAAAAVASAAAEAAVPDVATQPGGGSQEGE